MKIWPLKFRQNYLFAVENIRIIYIYETKGSEYNLLFLKEHHNHEHRSENGNSTHQLQTQT